MNAKVIAVVAMFVAQAAADANTTSGCVSDAFCAAHGDMHAVCNNGACSCSTGYVNPIDTSGIHNDVCVAAGSNAAETMRLSWVQSCEEMDTTALKIVGSALNQMFPGRVKTLRVICTDSVNVVAHMHGAQLWNSTTTSLEETMVAFLRTSVDTNANYVWLAEPVAVGLGDSDRAECHVYGASEIVQVGGRCMAVSCVHPLIVADGSCIYQFHSDSEAGVTLTAGAIAGMVAAGLALIFLLALVTVCLCFKKPHPEGSETASAPYGNEKEIDV